MKLYPVILFFLLLWGGAAAQSYTYTNSRFKGSYGDGQDRSAHTFILEKVKAPTIVCEGDTAIFSIAYEGTFVCDFKWRKVGDNRDSWCDLPEMKLVNVTTASRGKYYCCLIDVRSGEIRYSDTVELKVKKRPSALIGDPAAPFMLCYGDSTTLNAIASENDKETGDTYSYSWDGVAIVGATNHPQIKISPKESTKYKVTVNNDGCRADTVLEVEVYRPVVDIPGVIYLAQDMPLQISVDIPSTATLQWKVGDRIVPHMNPLVFNGIDQTTNVYVEMTDRTCVAKDSGVVYFKRGMGYKGGVQDGFDRSDHSFIIGKINYQEFVCQGESARFSIDYEGTFVCDYEWKMIGSDEVLSDSSAFTIVKTDLNRRGKYFCKLTDISSGKEFFSDTVELKVKKRPVAIIGNPVSPKLICYGDTITLNASASEAGKEDGDVYTYSWSGDGIISNTNISLVKVAPAITTVYTVTVSNAGCSADTTVEIISYRPVVDIPDYVYISEGNTLELKVDVPSVAKLIWTAEGNVFEDINPFVYPDIRKTMDVTVKMLNEGCEASDKCKVYVKRGRGYQGGMQDGFDRSCNPPLILEQNRSEASCLATGAELWVKAEGSSPEYIWQKFNDVTKKFEEYTPKSGSSVSGIGTWKLTFDNLVMDDNGVYICEIKNECGSATTDTFSLSVGGLPVLKSGLNREWDQCVDGIDSTHLNVVALDPQGKEMQYSWYKVDTVNKIYTLLKNPAVYNQPYLKLLLKNKADEGFYLVNIHNECGNTRDSVFVPVNMPVKIIRDSDTKKKVVACVKGQAEFTIRTTGGGKIRYKLVKVRQVISQYPLKYIPDYEIVGGSKITLENLTEADEGNYVWEVDNGCGRDTLGFIELRVETPPVITGVSDTTELCVGSKLSLTCSASSPFSDLTYAWYKNGVNTGVTTPVYTINNAITAHAGNYVCRVNNSCPVAEGPVRRVSIKERPRILDRPYIKDFYCEGDTLNLKVEVGSVKADSMRWFLNGRAFYDVAGRSAGSASKALTVNGVMAADEGYYQVRAYNSCGASEFSESARLVVDRPARFSTDLSGYTDLVLCDGANQALTVSTTGTAPIRYIWTHNGATIAEGFSNTIQLKNAKADTAGQYCCEIQNRCGGKVACAEIKVSHPDTFRFELNSPTNQVCSGDPNGLTAVLMGSDTNTLYHLYKEPAVLVTKIHGKDLVTPGGFIEFKGLMGGTYYVMGEDTRFTKGCTYRMPGNVVITEHPLPVKFNLFIKEHFCKEQHQAMLAISGSQRDIEIEYTLYKLSGTSWVPYLNKVRGTGDTIVWKNIPEGSYKVAAANVTTGCHVEMNQIVEVKEHDLPVVYDLKALDGDSLYCANALSDVVLSLSGKDAETKYTLFRGDQIYRPGNYVSSWDQVESGVYRVEAVNKWGCRREMGRQRVEAQQSPVRTSIQGGMVYCENQTGTARIEIKNTDKATLYKVYRESPKTEYLDTMGSGGTIVLDVPLEDKRYYVIAVDTTAEHCSMPLLDTAVFKMSRLQVVGDPEEHYIWNGEKCRLPIRITGQEGQITVSWLPVDKLVAGDNTVQNPMTVPIMERQDFTVKVQDYSACVATATVSVIVKSDKLTCDIRETDKITSPDTLKACQDADINLYAWVDGGTGSYQYAWKDETGLKGSLQNLQNYSRQTDGWLKLEVKSAEITRKDSVWIKIYPNPDVYALQPGGLLCVRKNSAPQLKLSGSQAGVRYILSYSTDKVRYNEIDTVDCNGGDVAFTLRNAYTQEGFYTVRAEYAHNVITCRLPMTNVVEIRKGAELFPLIGDRVYCEGTGDTDTIRLAGSQRGVGYSLYRSNPFQLVANCQGTDVAIDFKGTFGSGEYLVLATYGVCTDTMTGRVNIIKNGSPKDLGIAEKGSYCEGDCPSRITLSGAESGVEYALMRKNFGLPDTEVERKTGTGTITFGQHCDVGEYYVKAYGANGCERIFKDRIRISGTLSDVNIEGNRKYCDAMPGYSGLLKITNPQDGATYQVVAENGLVKGTFDSVASDALYFRGLLPAGTYKIRAFAGRCSLDMVQTVTIEKQTLPVNNTITAPYTLCQGDGLLSMNVNSSAGFHYELYRDSSGVTTKLQAKPGTGGTLFLGQYDRIGDYYVMAKHDALGCEWKLSDKYHIDKALREFDVLGDTLYCASEEGVVISMSGTENNIQYILRKWDATYSQYKEVDRLTGKGMPVAFKGYFPAGTYQVKAVRGCEKLMKGELIVKSKAVPADSTLVVLEGNGCIDSTIVIRLQKSEPGVIYTLYHEGTKVGDSLQGFNLAWNIDRARQGTYKITADKDGCLFVFPKNIVIGELPFIRPLFGDTLLCANRYAELYMQEWDKEAIYTLYSDKGNKITTGVESGGKLYFSSVPVGTLYPVAARGNCEVRGGAFTIDSITVPVLPSGFWTVSECVKRGEGMISISGMKDTLRYVMTNTTGVGLLDYKGNKTDTVFRGLPFDQYCIYAEDERNKCRSDVLCATINESVTSDSLIGTFAYCGGEAGAVLRLSGNQRGMIYQMLTEDGDLIEQIGAGMIEFSKKYKKGKYIFRKERTGILGGCAETDTVVIDSFAYPATNLVLEVIGGTGYLCERGNYSVELKNTESGYDYILIKDPEAATESYKDTVAGTGSVARFPGVLTEKGFYKVYAQPAGGVCGAYMDTTFRVYGLPKTINAEGCSYCVADGEQDSCSVKISNLAGGVRYILHATVPLDTANGPGRANFDRYSAGTYYVVGEDLATGCRDTVAKTQIIANRKPGVYSVGPVCDVAGEIATTDGSNGDSVSYYLYKNGVQVGVPVKGNGANISFGIRSDYGVYKVKAVSDKGCESWMRDSATIYTPLADSELTQEGYYCKEGLTGVTIKYGCGSAGWNYFLKKGMWYTDTLKGEDRELKWTSIDANRILSAGTYELYAYNACGTRLLKSIKVKENPLPAVFRLEGNDAAICSGSGVEVVLSGSQQEVTYQLVFVNSGAETELKREAGTGRPLPMGNYSAIGQYIVYATLDSSGCRAKMDDKLFYPGATPELKRITGKDICLNGETAVAIDLCVTSPLQKDVDYLLWFKGGKQELIVDTLHSDATDLCFKTQQDTGCYYVVAKDVSSGCENTMDGQYCAGLPPEPHRVIMPLDTVKLCRGENYCIRLDGSDVGVKYVLMHNGIQKGQPAIGEGWEMEVGCVSESGVYKVKAFVSNDCWRIMEDSVIVIVNELQGMLLEQKYSYCEFGAGVVLGVKQPTNPACEYTLKAPDKTVLESRKGDPAGKGFQFTVAGTQKRKGYYEISVINTEGCERKDSVKVEISPLPEPYRLSSTNGGWLCLNGNVSINLDSSQMGIEYHLYRKVPGNANKEIGWKYGTGKSLTLATVSVAGEYFVEGINYTTGCKNNMYSSFILKQADTVRIYKVEALRTGYCYTDVNKGSLRLLKSQKGVVYELFRDGVATGDIREGSGGVLSWLRLDGKPCSNKVNVNDVGYLYEILARDTLTGCLAWMNGKIGIVEESDPAVIAWHPNKDLLSCRGKDVKFSLSATGCNLNYVWKRGDVVVKDTTEEFYNIESVAMSDFGSYHCEVSNSCGMVSTPPVQLKVRDTLEYLKRMEDRAVCGNMGESVMLTGYIQNGSSYEWHKLNDNIALSYSEWYKIRSVKPQDAGIYVFKAENECGVLTDTMELKVDADPANDPVVFRTDTICAGTAFRMSVVSSDTVKWYRDGVFTGITGNDYLLPAAVAKDEGLYSVRIVNACAPSGKTIPVAQLYVDDTIKIVSLRPSELVCENTVADLYIRTAPEKRVSYVWETGGVVIARNQNTYRTRPLTSDEPEYTYFVNYRNKCTDKTAAIRLTVSNKLEYKDPVSEVLMCAETAKDTAIYVEHPATLIASYQWYWQKFEMGADPVKLEGEVYDTLRLKATTAAIGYYYCEIGKVCNPVTTNSCWLRVDTVPVLKGDLPANDTTCQNSSYRWEVPATGGGLTYEWNFLLKDGTREVRNYQNALLSSTGFYEMSKVDARYDSCRIWCRVYNDCGEKYTGTMLLRVKPQPVVRLTPSDTAVCSYASLFIKAELMNGNAPWSYAYTYNGGSLQTVVCNEQMDTLPYRGGGTYRIERIETDGCVVNGTLGSVNVEVLDATRVRLVRETMADTLCFQDTLRFRLKIEGGVGPWELSIRNQDGDPAYELGMLTDPFVFSGREKGFELPVRSSGYLYVDSVRDLNGTGTCPALYEDTVRIVVDEFTGIIMNPVQNSHVGVCHTINLDSLFAPRPSVGQFYINNIAVDSVWNPTGPFDTVRYEVKSAHGCSSYNELIFTVDSLPGGRVILPPAACGDDPTEVNIQLMPGAQNYQLTFRQSRYTKGVASPRVDVRTVSVPVSSGGVFKEPISWNPVGGVDSCLVYEILDIRDGYGCKMNRDIPEEIRDSLYRAVIIWRRTPVVDIHTLYPSNGSWQNGHHDFNISEGDSVGVWAKLISGQPEWHLPGLGITHIQTTDTVFSLKKDGMYYFRALDSVCMDSSALDSIKITYVKDAYLRGKLWLEGPFDPVNKVMSSRVADKLLTLYGLSSWPAAVNGHDVIDYIALELREGATAVTAAELSGGAKVVFRDTCLLLANGQFADRYTGDSIVRLKNLCGSGGNNYYIVVSHRNHMGVMGANVLHFSTDRENIPVLDLTRLSGVYCRDGRMGNHMSNYDMIWMLSAGELNANSLISIFDPNQITLEDTGTSGIGSYDLLHDVNFDGRVDWPSWNGSIGDADWSRVRRNRNKFSEIKY